MVAKHSKKLKNYIAGCLQKFVCVYAVCLVLSSRSTKAQLCEKNFKADSRMECKRCSGKLKMEFAPSKQYSSRSDIDFRDLYIAVNKPSNVSIYFDPELKWLDQPTLKLRRPHTNNNCNYKLTFEGIYRSICLFGKFTCVAVTDAGERISKSAVISSIDRTQSKIPNPKFIVEEKKLQKSGNLILGSWANLSCSYISRGWNAEFSRKPFIKFWRINHKGQLELIKESGENFNKRYEWQTKLDKEQLDGGKVRGTRKLFIRQISESDSTTYTCEVVVDNKCKLERNLTLKARPCMAGHYCSRYSSKEWPCKEGTYSNVTGLFNSSGCRTCPMNSYCVKGSIAPIRCPMHPFFSHKDTTIKIFEGKKSVTDCKQCPVDPCDKAGHKCTFICSDSEHTGIFGQSVRVSCSLSDGTLLKNLTWHKGGIPIANSSLYSIYKDGNTFVLLINKLSVADVGNYTCSGIEQIMGNHVYSETTLNGSKPTAKSAKTKVVLILALAGSIIFAIAVGTVLRKRWSPCKSSTVNDKRSMTYVTSTYSESFSPDARRVFTRLPSEDTNHSHDVFICYSNADKVWVRKTLLPKLQSFNLRVFIDFQDFCPGSFIIENIADAISSSRKTVAVLSPDFVSSAWCKKELMMALTRIEAKHQVIPVMYRVCQVPQFLYQRTYLDWCNEDVRETFWEQLLRTINDGCDLELDFDVNDEQSMTGV